MSNTLTGLIPTIYAGLSQVSRELIGFIPNVSRDSTAESGAVGQVVRSPVAPQNTLEDIVPGRNPADTGDQTMEYFDVSLTKAKAYPIRWSGEEQLSVGPNGIINNLLAQQFEQGFRTIANAVEADLGLEYRNAGRAYGTPGTTPFATADDHSDFAEMNRILDEHGAPQGNRVMIVGSAARAKLEGKQASLFKVNESGDDGALLRNRDMRQLHGFTMGFSAGIKGHTAGTASGYLTDLLAGYAAGDTNIHLDTGTGDFLAGDSVSFAGNSAKYILGASPGDGDIDIVLNGDGLIDTLATDALLTRDASYTANMAFHESALLLAARAPAMPDGGDSAEDVITVTDPLSGLSFQVAMYREYRRIKYEIGLVWGTASPNPKWSGVLQG